MRSCSPHPPPVFINLRAPTFRTRGHSAVPAHLNSALASTSPPSRSPLPLARPRGSARRRERGGWLPPGAKSGNLRSLFYGGYYYFSKRAITPTALKESKRKGTTCVVGLK